MGTMFLALLLFGSGGEPTGTVEFPRLQVVRIDGEGLVNVGHRVEYRIAIPRTFENPYDERQVRVRMGFWRDGDPEPQVVEGFWHQPFRREVDGGGGEAWVEDGEASFRVRFRPLRAGTWRGVVEAQIAGEGTSQVGAEPLLVTGTDRDPFVRVALIDGRNRLVRDGQPFFPFGFNTGWAGARGTGDYERWFPRCARGFSRKWMTAFDGTALEWLAGQDGGAYQGLGRLNQRAAARLDRILDLAETWEVALQLVLQQHSQFETSHWSSWAQNPWNAANGGPCEHSMEFFTRPEVVEGFDRRLRYIVARYGDSPAILAWELWNEVDLIEGYDPDIVMRWSRERVSRIRQWDPYGHLVTTSYALPAFGVQDWGFEGYDLVQLHSYLEAYWDALELFASPLLAYGKPVLVAEFGIDYLGEANRRDRDATHLVNATLWGVMLGYTGGVMSWWWDSWLEEPEALEGWNRGGRALERLGVNRVDGPFLDLRLVGIARDALRETAARVEDGLLVWLHDPRSEWDRDREEPFQVFSGVGIEVSVPGQRCQEWMAVMVHDGDREAERGTAVDRGGGWFEIGLPAFSRDLLLRLRCREEPSGAEDILPEGPEGSQEDPGWSETDVFPEFLETPGEEEGSGPDAHSPRDPGDLGMEESAAEELPDAPPRRKGGGCHAAW